MGKVSINSTLYPYRISLRERKPAHLEVELVNREEADKLLSLSILLPDAVAFDKSGLNRGFNKKLDLVKSKESKRLSCSVFPTAKADKGTFQGKLVVSEFASDYEYLTAKYTKDLFFRIVD